MVVRISQIPQVTLLAFTRLNPEFNYLFGPVLPPEPGDPDSTRLIEFAGRNCYQSWDRPNEETNTPTKYVEKTIHEKQHYSIMEHASATFLLQGVSRSFLAELTRHRHLSFSVLSQRFVSPDKGLGMVLPPALQDIPTTNASGDPELSPKASMEAKLECFANESLYLYNKLFDMVMRYHPEASKKQAAEAARCVLPNATATSIVVTGNFRTWSEIIQKRSDAGVDAEFRSVIALIAEELYVLDRAVFGKVLESAGLSADPKAPTTYKASQNWAFDDFVNEVSHWNMQVGQIPPNISDHMKALFHVNGDREALLRPALNFFLEEVGELKEAVDLMAKPKFALDQEYRAKVLTDLYDAFGDVLFTLLGLAVKTHTGYDLSEVLERVCESNRTKFKGGKTDPETGKFVKGEGFVPPDFKDLVNQWVESVERLAE
jgi:thymidylate synthase (FAD)